MESKHLDIISIKHFIFNKRIWIDEKAPQYYANMHQPTLIYQMWGRQVFKYLLHIKDKNNFPSPPIIGLFFDLIFQTHQVLLTAYLRWDTCKERDKGSVREKENPRKDINYISWTISAVSQRLKSPQLKHRVCLDFWHAYISPQWDIFHLIPLQTGICLHYTNNLLEGMSGLWKGVA